MQQSRPRGTTNIAWIGLLVAAVGCGGVVIMAVQHGSRPAHAQISPEPGSPERAAAAIAIAIPDAPMTLSDASRRVSIEMYSAAWCSACGRAKAWMHQHDVAFHEIDVDQRAGAIAQLQMLNPRRTLPTFDVDGQVLVGFEEPRLRTAIEEGARRSGAH